MDSFDRTTQFCFNPSANTGSEAEFSVVLEINIHHARNIHNICIYDNQDVYAKFSLTYDPDKTLSTRIINGGGKNPEFNEKLAIKVTQFDAVLKCEMWMLSRAKNYLEDQLLGFALVPISTVLGKGKVTQDFSLSSTDLFHSPAGTVRLTLSLNTDVPVSPALCLFPCSAVKSSIASDVVLLHRKISEVSLDPIEYSRVEFPDMNVAQENQQMVSEYFGLAGQNFGPGSFLCLGASSQTIDDYEMEANLSEDNNGRSVSPDESLQNSGFLSSTMTSLSDDRNSSESTEKKNYIACNVSNLATAENNKTPSAGPDTPTSMKGNGERVEREANFEGKGGERNKDCSDGSVKLGKVFGAPAGNVDHEAEQSKMQQQIVDMYIRSMQQFTESLAKMKLPMNLDKAGGEDDGDVIQNPKKNSDVENKKKDSSRVFYGSRAFF